MAACSAVLEACISSSARPRASSASWVASWADSRSICNFVNFSTTTSRDCFSLSNCLRSASAFLFFSSSWASSSSTFTLFSVLRRSSSVLRRSACLSFSSSSTRVASSCRLLVPSSRSIRSICVSFSASWISCLAIWAALAAEALVSLEGMADDDSTTSSSFDFPPLLSLVSFFAATADAATAAASTSARCSMNSFRTLSNLSSKISTSLFLSSNSMETLFTSLLLTARSSCSSLTRISSSFIASSN
mmetsp:Transcript_3702/g.8242  ORF Transcript_3702/g.8242 Transcript_3702/m.8242 type:complete len:247 (-) Transcript_3702:536-1276(-)